MKQHRRYLKIKYESSPQKISIDFDPSYEKFERKKTHFHSFSHVCNYVKFQKTHAT
jgi:hypothetical protein